MGLLDFLVAKGAQSAMSEKQFLEKEIELFKKSATRKWIVDAYRYYTYDHDILKRKKYMIRDGIPVEVPLVINNKLIDNRFALAVDKKVNYSFAKDFTVETENETYSEALNSFFDNRFRKKFKSIAKDAISCGIGYLHPYYDEKGDFKFKRFEPWEVLPFWKDSEHTELDGFLRIYKVEGYEGIKPVIVEKVEFYTTRGVDRYILRDGQLMPDIENPSGTHFISMYNEQENPLNWDRVPLIAFKFNDDELPLLKRCKSLQDALNETRSDWQNNTEEDVRNTVLVLENYEGEDLGEFRNNLILYGAVKVSGENGARGDVRTLTVEVNPDNYEKVIKSLRDAITENCRSIDSKDDRLGNNPNEMNIQSMYSDIDLDANSTELEFKAAFEDMLYFINAHFANTGVGDFTTEKVNLTFNRNMMSNEAGTIENCKSSVGMVSQKTILEHHPWVTNIDNEIKELEAEEQKQLDLMESYLQNSQQDNPQGGGVVEE